MAASDVVEAFKRLPSNSSREVALEGIIAELSSYEWREALHRLQERTFFLDIVASVPSEIIIHIFAYLDILTPFRLQCVSRRWQAILTTPEILQPLLGTWYSKRDRPLEGESSLKGQQYAICKLKADHLHRFRTGHFYTDIHAPIADQESWRSFYTATGDHPTVDFCDDTVAWIDKVSGTYMVKICNLRTGKWMVVTGVGREAFQSITLTDQLVAISTYSGPSYACDIATGEKRSFRLPSAWSTPWSCRGRSIGSVLNGPNENSPESTAFVWNFDSRSCRTFQIQNPRGIIQKNASTDPSIDYLSANVVLLNPSTETMLVCWGAGTKAESTIYFSRYTYTGEKIREGSTHALEFFAQALRFEAVDRCGGFRLCLRALGKHWEGIAYLAFTEQSDKFEYPESRTMLDDPRSARWKDTNYTISFYKDTRELQVSCWGTRESPQMRPLTFHNSRSRWPQRRSSAFLLLNDVFVVLFGPDYLHVWCFDKDINLPKAELEVLHKQNRGSTA